MNPADLFRHETDTVNLSAGETLFRAGDPGEDMYVVLEGALDIVVAGRVVETAKPGALIGEMALIEPAPRTATVVAAAPSRLARITLRRFHFLVGQTPFFATHVMRVLADRLRRMNELLKKERPQAGAGEGH